MNLKRLLTILCIGMTVSYSVAQKNAKEVLFTIDEQPYYIEDFNYVYNKNIDLIPESERDVKEYLNLYIDYKLKVLKAKELGLDTLKLYKEELNQNRNQLVARYLSSEKITDALIEEAYERSLKEINASHILFLLDPNARPQDSLKMYDKAMSVRNEIQSGASFSEMAKKYSDDPSAQENGGNVGFFSVFKMVYPFETGAYNTNVGDVSLPVRSQFGYHLIKVEDVRDTRGEISIAHLMLLKSEEGNIDKDKEVEKRIKELYKQLKSGADFEVLVKQYSDDKITKDRGGEIQRFTSGALRNPVLEHTAYALNNPNEISEPIETDYAWHIVRLKEKFPLPSFEAIKGSLKVKVRRDERSRVINDHLIEELKIQFPIEESRLLVKKLPSYFSEKVLSNSWKVTEIGSYKDSFLVKINNSMELKLSDFFGYVVGNQLTVRNFKEVPIAIEVLYKNFVETELKNYYTTNLEDLNLEFKALITEYQDGLLLFDLMQKEVWQKVKSDTVGYTEYYNNHKADYYIKEKASVLRFELTNKKEAKKIKKLLLQGKTKVEVLESFNSKHTQSWLVDEMILDTQELLKDIKEPIKEGVYDFQHESEFTVIQIKEVFVARTASLDEKRDKVISDYQEEYERKWMESLRRNKIIKRNMEVLKQM